MNEYGTSLRLTDNITPVLDRIMSAFDRTLDAYSEFSAAIGTDKGAAAIDAAAQAVAAAHEAVNGLNEALDQTAEKTQNAPAGNSFAWQSEPVEVFTNSGIDRFREEAQSALDLIGRLAAGQAQITAAARAGNLLPPQAIADLQTADARVQALRQRIAQIAGKPLNLVDARDNAELEQLRGQLAQALEIQRDLNRAVDTMDVEGANTAYRRLVSTIGGAERQIRDSTNEQGRLNEAIEDGGRAAAGLSGQLGGVLRAYAGIAGLRKLFDFGKSAFEGCTGLKSVTIPSGVTNIEDGAFKECTGLPSIVIPDSVTSVGAQAFYGCSALKNVTMPCSAEIVLSAFDDSEAIKKLRFTVGTGEWKISNKMSSPLFQGKNMTAVLDEGIPEIGEYGFYRCSGLTSITIPSSVTSIGDRAFYACTGLPEITILSYVTSIGKEAFRGCTGLRSASIDSGVIGESAFQECTGIESLAIGDAAESIGASAFYGCTQLTSVEIGGGVTGIGNSAFNNCRALTTITIPDKVTSIGEFAFYGCVQLTSATIGDGVTDVGKNAFKECAGLASITMPCSANIGQSAFSGCKAVTEVHLTKGTGTMTGYKPNTYEYTPWYVSRGNAMTVTLDEGILNIGSWAFYNCTGLTEITLPSSLVSIDAYAFNDCKGLTEIFISDNVTNIGAFAFSGCTYLTDVYYDGTPQMRRKITIQHSNTNLLDAEWHYLPLNAIEWKTLPKKLTYVTGEPLSVYGGAITTYYDHDVVEEEPLTADMVTGFDSSVLGKQTLTVMFGGKTLTYEIEVIAQIQIEGTVEWNAEDVQFKGTTPYVIANGSAQTPRFTVKNSADGSVIDPECYDFEYKENTDAGTGYVIVTFKGDYEGTCRGFFKIYLPATTKTWVENVSDGIKVGWEPVEGAAGYVIYRRAWSTTTNGWTEFKRWNNTTETTYIDGKDEAHKVYAGTRYQYGVKAYFARRTDPVSGALIGGNVGDNYNLGEVGPLKTTVRITTRKLVQVRPGKKEMTVKWEKSKNFTGYQIQIATDSAFKQNTRVIKIDNWETYWTTVRDLNSNTTYYVRIRSYQEFEGMTYFGEWSNVISCKTN